MWLIKLVAWKPLYKVLKQRGEHITNNINAAEESNKKAKQLADQRQAALDKSHDDAAGIISDAKDNGQHQRERIINTANSDAQTLKKNAQKSIEQQRQDVLAGTKNDVADLSIEIASKIIQKELKPEDQKALINSYIEGLGKRNAR
ncbi:MAG: ATP synthase F0 subunit B [Acetilactobacillus jinshanensis]